MKIILPTFFLRLREARQSHNYSLNLCKISANFYFKVLLV